MADSFSRLEKLPPLRLTAEQLSTLIDGLALQMQSGGTVETVYEISFPDGTQVKRNDSAAFLKAVTSSEQPLTNLSATVRAWNQDISGSIASPSTLGVMKSVSFDFRDFGSQFHISSSDPLWGKGAIQSLHETFKKYRPWYARLLGIVPQTSGALTPLPFFFVLVAALHERAVTTLLVVVVVLSLFLLVGNFLFWRQYLKRRVLPDTLIQRQSKTRSWLRLRLVIGGVAFAADLATLIAILVK